MTLVQLQAFVTAARLSTFSAAAHELGLSQPAVSDLIRRLEKELDVALFERGSRALVVTPAGEELLPWASQAVQAADDGRRAVRALHDLTGGKATFGLLRNVNYYLRADLAANFRRQYPQVRLRLVGQNSAETTAAVARGSIEAGLVTLPVDTDGLRVLPVARDEVLYASTSESALAEPRTIDQFCAAPLVLYDAHYSSTDPARRQLNDRAQLAGLRIEPSIEVEYLAMALDLVAQGFGDTIVCRAAVTKEVVPRGIGIVSFAEPMYDTLAFVRRDDRTLSSATAEMVRLSHEALLEHQDSPEGTAEVIASGRDIIGFLR